MRAAFIATITIIVTGATAWATPERPGWVQPANGIRFPARDAVVKTNALAPVGAAFYVVTRRALTRDQIAAAADRGLRYLGPVATYRYAFLRERADHRQAAWLDAQPNFLGIAEAAAVDRLEAELLEVAEPKPVWVAFYPRTLRSELLSLVPDAAERMRLPTGNGRPGVDAMVQLDVRTPEQIRALSRSPFVAAIGVRHPKVPHNANSRALSNADAIIAAPYNLDGSGILVGHWDGGSVGDHADFEDRVTNLENNGVSGHATHTAGTVLGAGINNSTHRGFAPEATMIAYDFFGNAAAERRAAKHGFYHQHDNHSWGSGSNAFGAYDDGAREFDVDARDLFLVAVKSAGNSGRESQVVVNNYGFDSLPPDSTGKNILVICATDDTGDLATFSSRGPTNDGRVKPDLCGNGQNLISTQPGGGYGGSSGTSMSAPSVTGIITLLAQLYQQEYGHRWTPDLLSAVLIHTVTDVFHPGPDYRHGWGNIDAKAAADLIVADATQPGSRIARGAVRDAQVVELFMDVPAGSPSAKVTIAWQDAFQNSTAARRLLNDVDLELISPSGQTFFPWTLDANNPFDDAVRVSKNDLDNIEQVLVDAPEGGVWTVRVTGTAITDPDLFVQGFVLATSHNLERSVLRVSPTIPSAGVVPDGDQNGLDIPVEIGASEVVESLRLQLELNAQARGEIRVILIHPDGTQAVVETEDQSTRRDIYAIYPDLRSYDDDVAAFYGRPGNGTWTVKVIDLQAGNDTRVIDAFLELDLDGAFVPPVNTPPIADAGPDQSAEPGALVALDGSLSFDPDGDSLSFDWSQASGPSVTIIDPTGAQPTLVAPDQPTDSRLVLRLTVDDGRGGVATDDVTIAVAGNDPGAKPNQPPIALVVAEQMVLLGSKVMLDASSSVDPDEDPLTFSWSQVAGEPTTLEAADTAVATFDATTLGMLTFRVEVQDDQGGIDLADVLVTVIEGTTTEPPEMKGPELLEVDDGCGCAATDGQDRSSGLLWLMLLGLAVRFRRRR